MIGKGYSCGGGGDPVLEMCYGELKGHLLAFGTGNALADNGVQYRLPATLTGYRQQRWDTRGQTGLKEGVGPLAPGAILESINALLYELNQNMGAPPLTDDRPLWRQ